MSGERAPTPLDEELVALQDSFRRTVITVWQNTEFMAQWRRLRGSTLGRDTRKPIEQMIDDACGVYHTGGSDEDFREFFEFVRDHIWLPWLANGITSIQRQSPRGEV